MFFSAGAKRRHLSQQGSRATFSPGIMFKSCDQATFLSELSTFEICHAGGRRFPYNINRMNSIVGRESGIDGLGGIHSDEI